MMQLNNFLHMSVTMLLIIEWLYKTFDLFQIIISFHSLTMTSRRPPSQEFHPYLN